MYNEDEEEWPSYSRLERQQPTTVDHHAKPCPLKSCRTCRQINNNHQDFQEAAAAVDPAPPPPTSSSCKLATCNRKDCNVGRHSKKSKSVFPKINFLDLSKIQRKKNMKMLPINAENSASHQPKRRKLKWNKSKEAFTKFLDTLTRTFCLPLLG